MQRNYFLLAAFILLLSCKSSDSTEIIGITEIAVSDNGNEMTAADIEVNFTKQLDFRNVKEYRVFLIPADVIENFTLAKAEKLNADHFTSEIPEEVYPLKGITLSTNQLDTEGTPISSEEEYYVAVMSVSSNKDAYSNTLNLTSNTFQLSQNSFIVDHTSEMDAGAGSISVTDKNVVYMSDYDVTAEFGKDSPFTYSVRKIDKSGSVVELDGMFKVLGGNGIHPNGSLIQAVYLEQRVVVIDDGGSENELPLEQDLIHPDGIYVDDSGMIHIADGQKQSIYITNMNGEDLGSYYLGRNPKGITGDGQGNLFVSHNDESGRISKITPGGDIQTLANIPTYVSPEYPLDFFMWLGYLTYHEGYLYVAGTSTHTIYKVDMDGKVEIFIGTEKRGLPRGDIRTAKLNRPMGIAIGDDGNTLYFSGSTDAVPQHTQYSRPSKIYRVTIF